MIDDQIKKTDLNLLTALYFLITERSVTKAAQQMLISQPAMSRTLDRLRLTFEDKLLVRDGNQYEPTERALNIVAELEDILPRVGGLFLGFKDKSSPSTATCLFRIAVGDFGANLLIPGLVYILADCAPGIRIDVIPRRHGLEGLETNEVDLVLGRVEGETTLGCGEVLRAEPLMREKLVCLVRSRHPLAKRPLTLQRYVNAQHISLSPTYGLRRHHIPFSETRPQVARVLERSGHKLDVRVRVPYLSPVGLIVANTDLIATLPLQIARRLVTAKTTIVPAPKEFGGSFTFDQVWRSRDDSKPVHKLIRDLIRTLTKGVLEDLASFPDGGKEMILGLSKASRSRIKEVVRHFCI